MLASRANVGQSAIACTLSAICCGRNAENGGHVATIFGLKTARRLTMRRRLRCVFQFLFPNV